MATKPTIVIVPGAWSTPSHYAPLRRSLLSSSFPSVHIPPLPTNNAAHPPNSSYQADVDAIRTLLTSLVDDQGFDVVLIMHSYGGAVGTSACEGFARKDREARGLPGGVVHLLYLCAYLLRQGESVWALVERSGLGGDVAGHVTIGEDGTWLLNDPVWAMYSDLDPEDQEVQKSLVVPHNLASLHGETTYEAWKDVPSTYVYTTEDRCVPPAYQDLCIENAREAGVSLGVVTFHGGHSPYAKYPREISDLVVRATSHK